MSSFDSAAASANDTVTIQSAHVLRTDPTHYNSPICVAFHPTDSNIIAVSYFNRTIKLWDVTQQKIIANFSCTPSESNKYNIYEDVRESSRARFIAWHPSGNYFVAGFDDRSVKIYQPHSQAPVHELLHDGFGPLTSLEFSADGSQLLVVGAYANMLIYNTHDYTILAEPNLLELLFPQQTPQRLVNLGCATFSHDCSVILFANGKALYELNTRSNKLTHIVNHTSSVLCVKCKEDKTISGSKTELIVHKVGGIKESVGIGAVAISFNDEETLVAVIDKKDNTVKIIDSNTGRVYHKFGDSSEWSISWVGPRIAYCDRRLVQTLVVSNTEVLLDTILEVIDSKLSGKQLPSDLGLEVLKFVGTPRRQADEIGKVLTSKEANPSSPPPAPAREFLMPASMPPPPPESFMSPPVKSRKLGESDKSVTHAQIQNPIDYNKITPDSNSNKRGRGGKTKRKRRSKTTKKLIAKNLKKRSLRIKRK